jgi:hypothetical protein
VTIHSIPPDVPIYSIFTTGYAVALFTPTIVHDLGYSAANAQLLSVPPFACAGVSTIIMCFFSDRANLRGPFLVLCSTISMIGYIIAYITSHPGPGYVATVFAASGAYPNVALLLAWAGGNSGGNMKRGVVLALVIGLGNLGGYVFHLTEVAGDGGTHQSNPIPQDLCFIHLLSTTAISYGPRHNTWLPCYEVCTGTSSQGRNKPFSSGDGSIICSCIMMWTYGRLNQEKEELCAREGINESMKDIYRDLADKSPLFR